MSIETMKLALEALETNNKAWKSLADSGDAGWWEAEEQPFYEMNVKSITALRQAIEQAQKQEGHQEPVAWQDTAKPTELVAAEDWDNIMANTQTTGKCTCNRLPLTDEQKENERLHRQNAVLLREKLKAEAEAKEWFDKYQQAAHGITGEQK